MIEQKDTAGWRGEWAGAETWEQFDALPVPVKRLYWYAPFNYTATGAYWCMRNGGDLRANVVRQVAAFERDVARESARLYGEAQVGWVA